jgi:hypothetical protein
VCFEGFEMYFILQKSQGTVQKSQGLVGIFFK